MLNIIALRPICYFVMPLGASRALLLKRPFWLIIHCIDECAIRLELVLSDCFR